MGQSAAGTREVATGIGQGMPLSDLSVPQQPLAPTEDAGHESISKEGSWTHNTDSDTPRPPFVQLEADTYEAEGSRVLTGPTTDMVEKNPTEKSEKRTKQWEIACKASEERAISFGDMQRHIWEPGGSNFSELGVPKIISTLEVPSSRIVLIEGIYALSEKLRPLLDLRVSVTGGIHFDLVKRVLRDIQRAGQEPEEIIHQISETVYPMYKAFIEPDLRTAHIKIVNKFNPFTGFQNPIYILKSTKTPTVDQIKAVISGEHKERMEETYDIFLLPPGEDPEACQSYLRMRNRDGKYNLMFEVSN
ncbi:hypothetical protein GIB67_015873 [Kingdonia uniflora]|uniref:CYTH domain-containing protein n=1 Tax=Kingdonia uniflora TaxID=39325 RepID=A0A7J7NGP7_9MAGN|nr:hypothetical protein GIB67_015873 [Kingdonia uniflora]